MAIPLPALTDTYHTRNNVPFGSNNTTTLLLHQYFIWALKAAVMNEHSTGTTGGAARTGSNTAVCLGSGNGTTGALDGVDRWTSTFTPANLVRAASGSAHSWFAFRLGGYDYVIDMNSTTDSQYAIRATKTSQGLTGGTNTVAPAASGNNEEFLLGTNSVLMTATTSLYADHTLNQATYFHFTINADGTKWWFGKSRIGQGMLDGWNAFWPATGGRAADTRNVWWLRCSSTASRGSPANAALIGTGGSVRRGYANAAPYQIGFGGKAYSSVSVVGLGADMDTTDYLTFPIEMCYAATPPLWCGRLPDLYITTGGTVGSQPFGDTSRLVLGDLIVPGHVQPIV